MENLQNKMKESLKISKTTKETQNNINSKSCVKNLVEINQLNNNINLSDNINSQDNTNTKTYYRMNNAVSKIHEYAINFKMNVEFEVYFKK